VIALVRTRLDLQSCRKAIQSRSRKHDREECLVELPYQGPTCTDTMAECADVACSFVATVFVMDLYNRVKAIVQALAAVPFPDECERSC
jgi:hypothetical protein